MPDMGFHDRMSSKAISELTGLCIWAPDLCYSEKNRESICDAQGCQQREGLRQASAIPTTAVSAHPSSAGWPSPGSSLFVQGPLIEAT